MCDREFGTECSLLYMLQCPEIGMKKTGCSECNSKGIFHTKRPEDRNEDDWEFGAQWTRRS